MTRFISRILPRKAACLLGATALWLSMQSVTAAQMQFAPVSVPAGTDSGQRRVMNGGGSVTDSCAPYVGLTALVPQVDGVVWSQTVAAKPTFFFQVPAALNNDIPLLFVVEDDDGDEVYRRRFRLRTEAGVLAIPVRGEGLALGETYRWTFAIDCQETSSAIAVSGTVRRIEGPTVERGNRPEVRMAAAEAYAAAGVWHEALENAIALAQAEPGNVAYRQNLESLLRQVGLADALTEP